MQRKTFRALNFLCEIFRGSAFVSRRKSHLLKIKCLFILVKKQLEQKLSSEREGRHFPKHGRLHGISINKKMK